MGSVWTRKDASVPKLEAYTYPYAGQRGVKTTFRCNESPNPCTVVRGNRGRKPTGLISTVQFAGPWEGGEQVGPRVTRAKLVRAGGRAVAVTVEDRRSKRSANLGDGLSIIPNRPLRPSTWYRATVVGTFGYRRSTIEPEPVVGRGCSTQPGQDFWVCAESDPVEEPFRVSWRFRTARGNNPL